MFVNGNYFLIYQQCCFYHLRCLINLNEMRMRTHRRLSRKSECRRRGLTGVYPCGGQSPLSQKIEMFIIAKLNVAKKYQVSNTQINNGQ